MLNPAPSIPYFEVFINGGTPLPNYASCVKIIQQTNAHTVALLDVVYVGKNIANSKTNSWKYLPEHTPIQINYGQRPHFMYPFCGYVSSYKMLRSGNDAAYGGLTTTTVQYTITGTSQIMQSTKNVAWKHTSPSTIAATIAAQNGFRAIVHTYQAAINYRLQNVSDFKFLAQLADEIGYRFYIDNTDLYFVNPQLILDRSNVRNIPSFWSYNQVGLYDTIQKFHPVVGTITPDGGILANRNVVGLNPNTNTLVQVSNLANATTASGQQIAPTIEKYYSAHPAESYYEANQKVVGDALRNLYWNYADAEFWGDSRVKPNVLVNLTGTALTQDELGIWLVNSVTHELYMPPPTSDKKLATYTMSAELGRDQIHTNNVSLASQSDAIAQTIPASLVGGTWRSTNIGATIYAT